MSSSRISHSARITALITIALAFAAIAVVACPGLAMAVPTTSSDATATYANTAVIHLTATPGAGGIYKTTMYSIDGAPLTAVSANPTAATVSLTATSISMLANHTLTYFSIDATSSTETTWGAYTGATTVKTFSIYSTYPSTVALGISSTYMNSATINLVGVAAAGGMPVAATWSSLDGGAPVSGATVNVSAVGAHTLKFWTTDTGGNAGIAQTVPFTVLDTIKPAVSSNAVASYVGAANITLTGTDAGSGIDSLNYSLDGGDTVVVAAPAIRAAAGAIDAGTHSPAGHFATGVAGTDASCAGCHTITPAGGGDTPPPGTLSTSVGVTEVGSHTLEFWAVDGSGLAGTPQTVTFAVTSAGPVATSITIKSAASVTTIGKTVSLSGLCTPTPDMVGKNMVVMVKKPGKAYWSYSSNRTVYSASGVAAWLYKYTFKSGMAKGVYQFKAVVEASTEYVRSESTIAKITVR
jgi:hypothetical protein